MVQFPTTNMVQTKSDPKKEFNPVVEVFLSLVKWFLIFIVINNLIWAGIYSYTLHKASSDTITSTDVWQEGDTNNNNQSITNG